MNKKAFTLVELVVVITILVILSAVGFVSFSSYLGNARDTQRKSDLIQLKSALKHFKEKNKITPNPGSYFNINYGTNNTLAIQGVIDNSVNLTEVDFIPKDPKAERAYVYSKTKNSEEFQLAATLENSGNPLTFLVGDYKTISKTILPTIVVASSSQIDISDTNNKNKFIYNNQGVNLPYQINGNGPVAGGVDITSGINSADFYQSVDFRSCDEIKNSTKYLSGVTTYEILNASGSIEELTGCTN